MVSAVILLSDPTLARNPDPGRGSLNMVVVG